MITPMSWVVQQILVQRYQDPKPYRAQVKYIGHDCDLALLTVEDPAFAGIEPKSASFRSCAPTSPPMATPPANGRFPTRAA